WIIAKQHEVLESALSIQLDVRGETVKTAANCVSSCLWKRRWQRADNHYGYLPPLQWKSDGNSTQAGCKTYLRLSMAMIASGPAMPGICTSAPIRRSGSEWLVIATRQPCGRNCRKSSARKRASLLGRE